MQAAATRRAMRFSARFDDRTFRTTPAATALSVWTIRRRPRKSGRRLAQRTAFSTTPSYFALICLAREAEPGGYRYRTATL